MRFHLRRKAHRTEHHHRSSESSPPCPDPDDSIDVDAWAASGIDGIRGAVEESPLGGASSLRDRLLAVLADEDASLVPPSAGDMTQQEWNELSEAEREGFRRQQLTRVDPRFVPHYTMNSRRSGSRSARVYR